MSASNKKKLRKEQEAARMTERQKAQQKEAKKLKAYTWTFCIAIVLVVCIVLGFMLQSPINVLVARVGTSMTIGEHKLSHTEMNYFYIDAINQFCNQYSSYLSYLVDTSTPLDEQVIDEETGRTQADYFIDQAIANAKNTYALYDAAKAAGYEMSADEKASLEELYADMDSYAENQGYSSATKYLQSIYGASASEKSYKEYYEVTVMAQSYYYAYSDQLKDSYAPETLRAFEGDETYTYNSYSYATFYMTVDDYKEGGTKDEEGNMTYTDEEIAAAEAALKSAATALAVKENNTVEKLNAAIAEMEKAQAAEKEDDKTEDTDKEDDKTEDDSDKVSEPATQTEDDVTDESTEATEGEGDAEPSEPAEDEDGKTDEDDKTDDKEDEEEEEKYSTCTEQDDVLYTKISSVMQEWIRDTARAEGDITALPYESTSTVDGEEVKTLKGYYVVLYLGSNDNTYALANVRHILISFEGGTTNSSTGVTTYSDAEKAAAKAEAEALLKEWEEGEATEDSFAALVHDNTGDEGSKETGGLYEDVYPGQMVTNFNDWCFDEERKPGDTGIVESDYGYHIMYYVSDSETNYRDYLVTNAKLSEDIEAWSTALLEALDFEVKSTKHIDTGLILANSLYSTSTSSDDHEGHNH